MLQAAWRAPSCCHCLLWRAAVRHQVAGASRARAASAAAGQPEQGPPAAPQQQQQQQQPAPRPPRFYVPNSLRQAAPGAVLRLPPDEARHATRTLRLREGDALELCDGRGHTLLATLGGVDKAGAAVHAAGPPALQPRTGWQWDVACACGSLKGGRSDWLVEKAAELGAAAFTPVLTERSASIGSAGGDDERGGARSARRPKGRRSSSGEEGEDEADEASGREGRWGRVATAAMKQCLRAHALELRPPCTVAELAERVRAADAAFVGVGPASPPLADAAAALAGRPPGTGLLLVGPEGDWTPDELSQLLAAGAVPVALGDLRLRAETAALALLAYVRLHLH